MSEKRYLISIGINDYEIHPLDWCAKDAEDIQQCCINYCNVEEGNVFPIISTYNKPIEDIKSSMEKAISRIEANFQQEYDSVFFFFSGHGIQAKNSTTLIFKNITVTLQEIFARLLTLKPRFIFFLIDSCFSGVGIQDEIGKSSEEYLLHQHVSVATGYNIFCATAHDKTAKEDSKYQNGRFTKLFIEIVSDKKNYSDGILNLSKVFHLLDEKLKETPKLSQLPFAQNKGLSTYPIAALTESNNSLFFTCHYIEDIEAHNWTAFKNDLATYCSLKMGIVNEFTRLIREMLRNSKRWGGASFLKVEIGKSRVSLIDNSGKHFDIFHPTEGTKIRGGGTTAKIFAQNFADYYNYNLETKTNETIHTFLFKNSAETKDVCRWELESIFELHFFQFGIDFKIPESCPNYKIFIPHGGIDLSTSYSFLESMIKASQESDKFIYIHIHDSDKLKKEFIEQLKFLEDKFGKHKVVIV